METTAGPSGSWCLVAPRHQIMVTDGRGQFSGKTCVERIDHMGSDDSVVNAARVSFDRSAEHFSEESNVRLLNFLARENHWSPFAHTSVSMRFSAPIFISRQFVKHQVGFAWNEVSRRYVTTNIEFFVPETWRGAPANRKQGSDLSKQTPVWGNVEALQAYTQSVGSALDQYEHLLAEGVCPEQARSVLPLSMMTEWIWTGSLMAWRRFYDLRGDEHAQAECWPYADTVGEVCSSLFPHSWDALDRARE